MLKTGFIGGDNFFDRMICEWLSEHTELRLIIWTESWARGGLRQRTGTIVRRFLASAVRKGGIRALDEVVYHAFYQPFLARVERARTSRVVDAVRRTPRRPLEQITQVRTRNLGSPSIQKVVASHRLDALFARWMDMDMPDQLLNTPRHGVFLWHDGIAPEYRGVYSPFWALLNRDFENLGWTLLKMNSKLDGSDVYLQGKAEAIDPERDWHGFIGHKAVVDSLPAVKQFLADLEAGRHRPLPRPDAAQRLCSYPTASSLLTIAGRRWRRRIAGALGRDQRGRASEGSRP